MPTTATRNSGRRRGKTFVHGSAAGEAATVTGDLIYLRTQAARARFCRDQLRAEGWTTQQLADRAGLCLNTVMAYLRLPGYKWLKHTKDPRTDTTRSIFEAFGYAMLFGVTDESKKRGTVVI